MNKTLIIINKDLENYTHNTVMDACHALGNSILQTEIVRESGPKSLDTIEEKYTKSDMVVFLGLTTTAYNKLKHVLKIQDSRGYTRVNIKDPFKHCVSVRTNSNTIARVVYENRNLDGKHVVLLYVQLIANRHTTCHQLLYEDKTILIRA